MNNKLFIRNLSFKTTEQQLKEEFSKFGKITECVIPKDRESGQSRGFGFVTFEVEDSATTAILKMNGKELNGRNITVQFSDPNRRTRQTSQQPGANDRRTKNVQTDGRQNNRTQNLNMPEFYLPSDTLSNINHNDIDNFALKFHKFPRFEKDKFLFYKTHRGEERINDTEFNFSGVPFDNLNKEILKSAQFLFPNTNKFGLKIDWRLAIGLGTESVYETSMTLHPIYGFPYIPGQALKGITRSWIIRNLIANENDLADQDKNAGEKLEKKAFQNETFCILFGCPKESILKKEHQGSVTFFDSFPIEKPNLKVDIMNPHYDPYYSKGKPPADYYNPKPIYFLTVEDAKFQFVIGLRETDNTKVDDFGSGKNSVLELTGKYLKKALQNQGIGAKTAVGYGYFK